MARYGKEDGFTVIEALLVSGLVALISLVGYLAAMSYIGRQQSAEPAVDLPRSSTDAPRGSSESAGTLVIKEWGVKGPITIPVTYSLNADNKRAAITSQAIAAAYPSCQGEGNVGSLLRRKAGELHGMPGKPIEQFPEEAWQKVGEYYYVFEEGHQFCGQADPRSQKGEDQLNFLLKQMKGYQENLTKA